MRRMKNERGAAAMFTALTFIVLIGFSALAVDIGALWWDKKELQNGADAAALAIAESCAKGEIGCSADVSSDSLYRIYADGNNPRRNILTPGGQELVTFRDNSVTAVVRSERQYWFGRIFTQEPQAVYASATASWGRPTSASVLPLTVSACNFPSGGAYEPDAGAPPVAIKITDGDKSKPADECAILDETGVRHYVPGGFGWLASDAECRTQTEVDTAYSDQGSNYSSHKTKCESTFGPLKHGSIIFIPVFDNYTKSTKTFTLSGYAQFRLESACFGASLWNFDKNGSGYETCSKVQGHPGNGNNAFINGTFLKMVSLDSAELGDGGQDYGVVTVKLTN